MKVYQIILLIFLFFSACAPSAQEQATPTAPVITPTNILMETPANILTPTQTFTPTVILTPTIEISPTAAQTATPTFAFPSVTVNKQAHC